MINYYDRTGSLSILWLAAGSKPDLGLVDIRGNCTSARTVWMALEISYANNL